tara:strand:- start:3576 stop:4949 length:1374 start_codon:yes stop_codon:yes gene_type:complete
LKIWGWSAFGFVFLTVVGLFAANSYQEHERLNEIESRWSRYLGEVEQREHLISDLKEVMGFGRLIHNFKNYVIRGNSDYRQRFYEDHGIALSLLKTLENLSNTSKKDFEEFKKLRTTVNFYFEGAQKLEKLKFSPNIHDRDLMVRVNDGPAAEAFAWFHQKHEQISHEYKAEVQGFIQESKRSQLIGTILSLIFTFLSLAFAFSIWKYFQKTMETERERESHSLRVTALGQLSGNIAHEINNPLAIIRGYVEIIEDSLTTDPIDKDLIQSATERIQSTIHRIGIVISGLYNLVHDKDQSDFEVVKFENLLSEVDALSRERCDRAGIDLSFQLPKEALFKGNPVQMGQVLLNLISNSIEAVLSADKKWIQVKVKSLGPNWELRISDSGPGISDEIKEKLEDPFFTVQSLGSGTGIGLSLSKTLIEKHGGKFYYDDKEKQTTFVIVVPKFANTRSRLSA